MSAILSSNASEDQGYKVIQWTGISQANPNGDWVNIAGWLIASVDWEGTPGAAPALQVQGSNQVGGAPSTNTSLAAFAAAAVGLLTASPLACSQIRPSLSSGGDGTTNMTCTIMLVR